jgi:hypothetical protein
MSDSRWFQALTLIGTGLVIGVTVADVYFFHRIRSGNTVSNSEANTMMILNIIILVLAIIIFIWALYRIIFTAQAKNYIANTVTTNVQAVGGWLTAPPQGVINLGANSPSLPVVPAAVPAISTGYTTLGVQPGIVPGLQPLPVNNAAPVNMIGFNPY